MLYVVVVAVAVAVAVVVVVRSHSRLYSNLVMTSYVFF